MLYSNTENNGDKEYRRYWSINRTLILCKMGEYIVRLLALCYIELEVILWKPKETIW